MKTEELRIETLTLDPKNTRAHPKRNLDAIKRSLARFGQQKPIVVDTNGLVVAGNGTVSAAQELGWETITVTRTALEGGEARAFGIADNKTADLATWNEDALAEALAELRDNPRVDELATGFNAEEIERALRRVGSGGHRLDNPDNVPDAPETPVTQPGDLWILGEHRLLCGDSSNPADVARVMNGEKAVLMATDPPYCVGYTGDDRPDDGGKDWSDEYREIDIKDLGEFLRASLRAILPVLEDNAALYVWHSHLMYPTIDQVLGEFDILRHQPIVWSKPAATFTHSFYSWQHEPCIFGWRQGHKPPRYLDRTLSTVWQEDWEGAKRIVGNSHPTQKPVRLFEIPMKMHTRPGEVVFEPFSGSGSQLIAAEGQGRRCRAIEISPTFVDAAVMRWQEVTRTAAVLDGPDQEFSQVSEERL